MALPETIRTWASVIALVIAIAVAAATGTAYVVDVNTREKMLEGRVQALENQVHTITVAPFIAQAAPGAVPDSHAKESRPPDKTDAPAPPAPNALAAACAKLADTLAHQIDAAYLSSYVTQTQDAIKTLGCVSTKQ